MSAHRRIKRFDENTFLLLATPKYCGFAARIKDAQLQSAASRLCVLPHTLLQAPGTRPSGAQPGFMPIFWALAETPPWARGREEPQAFPSAAARAGAQPGVSPLLPCKLPALGSPTPSQPPKAFPPPALLEKLGKDTKGLTCQSHSESHSKSPL